eukprot:4967652-Lingulodinium_polyedra.AAC.1
MFEDYAAVRGGLLSTDVEPSPEQFAGAKQLVDSGNPPYVEFSVSAPNVRRLFRRLMCTAC